MEKFILPPSPSWNLSNVLACNDDGVFAFGSRTEVVLIYFKSQSTFEVKFISKAHKEKINVIVFSPSKGNFKNCLATCSDDSVVRVWDFQEPHVLYSHTGHKDGLKVTGLDWSRADTNRLVSVNDLGSIVVWDLASNSIRKLHCGARVLPLCLACCPHDQDLVAIGCKGGVTLVINVKGNGKLLHRLRGNEQDVISLSWCPVPYNVIKHKREDVSLDEKAGGDSSTASVTEKPREFLLATSGIDKFIYLWRTSSDGRFEVVLNLPASSINFNHQKRKGNLSGNLMWVAVRWVDAYTLLSTSHFGELLHWDLNKLANERGARKLQPQLVHSKHNKGCFSIACPITYDVVSDTKVDQRTVWTTAMDKHIVACSLGSRQVLLNIPTVGGGIYSMATSPLDPNRVAVGSTDNKIFVWNMSSLHSLDITSHWKKIIGKVMALCWHPNEENWLAYGTGDGHVGLLDVGSNKLPILFRLHHRKSVYRLVWAPPLLPITSESKTENGDGTKEIRAGDTVTDDKLVLFSVADGDIWQYTADVAKPDEEPKSLNQGLLNHIDQEQGQKKNLARSEVAFKPDYSVFSVASDNGSIYIIGRPSLAVEHVITFAHKKCINQLEWHPQTVASENSLSPHRHWLASASENIKVYNVPPAGVAGQVELVASLSGHSEKVVTVAWSPHYNARLVSASYDYTVQLWDVVAQTCLGVCQAHSMAAMCALFSPMDADSIITGSLDNTVRLISVSNIPTTHKLEKRKDRVVMAIKGRESGQEATELTVDEESTNGDHKIRSASSSPTNTGDRATEGYRKRQKNRAVFTVTGTKLSNANHFETYFQRWLSSSASGKPYKPASPPTVRLSEEEGEGPTASDLGYLDFFGDSKAMRRLLMVEENKLRTSPGGAPLLQTSALWRGDISQMISEAIEKKKLSEWLVSLAPIAGFDVWEQACTAYVDQLVECGEVVEASTYLLAVHRAHDAVALLMDHRHYREAIAVAKCRLADDDPLIPEIYRQWGHASRSMGNIALAAHCFLAAGEVQDCIETLAKAKDLKALESAVKVARHAGHNTIADQLSVECLSLCLLTGNLTVARQLLTSSPQFQYWEVLLRARELVGKIKNRGEQELFDWMENGHTSPSLWEELAAVCSADQGVYDKLLSHLSTNKTPDFERDMWMYVSGQLGAASAAGWPSTQALRHTVAALSAAFHYQTHHPSSLALPFIVSLITPKGLFAEDSILNIDKTDKNFKDVKLLSSLKAFICASIVHWINNNLGKVNKLLTSHNEKVGEKEEVTVEGSCKVKEYKMSWLPDLLENCKTDVLSPENVAFFVRKAQQKELQNVITNENIQKTLVESKNKHSKKNKKKKPSKKSNILEENDKVEKPEEKPNNSDDGKITKKLDENLNITNGKKEISNTASEQKVHDAKQVTSTDQSLDKRVVKNENIVQKVSGTVPDVETINNTHIAKDECKKTIENGRAGTSKTNENGAAETGKTNENGAAKTSKTNENGAAGTSKTNENDAAEATICKVEEKLVDNGETKSFVKEGEPLDNGNESTIDENDGSKGKLKEIQELDEILQEFETERVSVPSPFHAYFNIKNVIDNLISKKDSNLAVKLQESCDKIWGSAQQ